MVAFAIGKNPRGETRMLALEQEQIAGLRCVIARWQEREPAGIALFCHGFGAPGDDLVGLVEEFWRDSPDNFPNVAVVFPAAPLRLDDGEGRAWWPIDVLRLQELGESGDLERLAESVPSGLADCRQKIENVLTTLQNRWGVPPRRCLVGGFSQGAMLATDVALHSAGALAGLVVWSGALIHREAWSRLAVQGTPLQVLQSHGFWDPILPFAAGTALRDLLVNAGHAVNFLSFQGYHSIPGSALAGCLRMLRGLPNVP